MKKAFLRAAAAPAAAVLLGGCLGGLLGGGKPAQMYRFGAADAPAAAGPAPAATRTIQLPPVEFADEIATTRLLASRGGETLYIKGTTWTAEAPALFTAALHDAFGKRAPHIALVDRRDGGGSAAVLQITVARFEAQYDSADKNAVPTIRIEGQAVLTEPRASAPGARYRFSASEAAASGRIDDVVTAFDAADAKVVAAIADWTTGR